MTNKEKWIIFDETDGKSTKGRSLKWIAEKYGIKYVTNTKQLTKYLEESKSEGCE